MKKTVKILALLMALIMAVFCFAGCGKDENASKEQNEKVEEASGKEENSEEANDENPEEEAKLAVQGYLDGYVKEIEDAKDIEKNVGEFIAVDSDAYSSMKEYMEEIESSADEGASFGISEEYSKKIILLAYNSANENSSYKIEEANADGEKVIVKVKAEIPDAENIENSEEFSNEIMTLLMEYLSENNMGLDVLMSNDEEAVNEIIAGFINAKYDFIAGYVEEMAKNAPKKTSEIIFTVEKKNDEWLITEIDDIENAETMDLE